MNLSTSHRKAPVSVRFTERMKGFVTLGQQSFEEGCQTGQSNQTPLMFELTIGMEDIESFTSRAGQPAQAIGYIDSPLFGGRRPVLRGQFSLFAASGDVDRRTMRYRLLFEDTQGNPLTLYGFKSMRGGLFPRIWKDTTTLFTTILKGHVPDEYEYEYEYEYDGGGNGNEGIDIASKGCGDQQVVATGILRIAITDFLHQLTTFQADAPSLSKRIRAIARFGLFFSSWLWNIYGKFRLHGWEPEIRDIPLHTLSGVTNAKVTTHYTSTEDGLGISLLQFSRAPCEDVVLLVPGLTASSDMFIMPEHYNLTQYLLDHGFTEVWTLDGRISNRHPYNTARHRYTVDDVALYDNPAAIEKIREVMGPDVRIHIISHCLGALSVSMSLFAGTIKGIQSVIANGVSLTPRVGKAALAILTVGPFFADNIFGFEYLNPNWSTEPAPPFGKLLSKGISLLHKECDVPACHMTSFMWGYGYPVLFKHANLDDATHRRTGDLFGGSGMQYHRHIRKMVNSDNTAVKYAPQDVRYRKLPDNYLQNAAAVTTPMLLIAGQENGVFTDSNILCHQRLEKVAPGRHRLELIPDYGHADVIIGKWAAHDIFPRFLEFLRANQTNRIP